jgi:8-oxo-dGTP pyrophosphatase MutT (NUDIX family)
MSSLGKDTKDVVGVICLDKQGKLLLVQGAGGKWSFPKGRRKEKETPHEGALREAKEEAGIDLSDEKSFLSMGLRFGTYFWYYFDTNGDTIPLAASATSDEILQTAWISPHSDEFAHQEKNADLRAYLLESNPKRKHSSKYC